MAAGTASAIAGGAGAVMHIAGTWLNANAAAARQREFQRIADTAGLNIGSTYQDTLGAMETYRPMAEAQAGAENTFNSAEQLRMLELGIPGFERLQAQRIRNAEADLLGEVTPERAAALSRAAAAQNLDRGISGSQAGNFSSLTSLGEDIGATQRRGAEEFASIIGTTPIAARVSPGQYLNIDPKTGLALRADERTQRMNILLQKAGLKGKTETWGDNLHWAGAALLASSGYGGQGSGADSQTGSGANNQALIDQYRQSPEYSQGGAEAGGGFQTQGVRAEYLNGIGGGY